MKSVAILPVRNEAWCLGLTLRALLMWVDEAVVLLHACTDDSEEIAAYANEESGGRVSLFCDDLPAWNEMDQRQSLLDTARAHSATHIVILDADELLTGNLLDTARQLSERPKGSSILRLPGYNLRNGIHQYHASGVWAHRWFSVAFADDPRLHWTGDCFHQREPLGMTLNAWQPVRQGDGGVMHLWGASERRLRAKHCWYRITERLRWPSKPSSEIEQTYRPATHGDWRGRSETWTFAPVPDSWWTPYAHLMRYLDLDAAPWQEAEIERAIAAHGRERFKGLDLLGY